MQETKQHWLQLCEHLFMLKICILAEQITRQSNLKRPILGTRVYWQAAFFFASPQPANLRSQSSVIAPITYGIKISRRPFAGPSKESCLHFFHTDPIMNFFFSISACMLGMNMDIINEGVFIEMKLYYNDIRKTSFSKHHPRLDIVVAMIALSCQKPSRAQTLANQQMLLQRHWPIKKCSNEDTGQSGSALENTGQ